MLNSTDTVSLIGYELFQDYDKTKPWDSGNLVGVSSSVGTDNITVYGRAHPSSATPGVYNDTVLITVTY
jgi:spore coat protein U-like protein